MPEKFNFENIDLSKEPNQKKFDEEFEKLPEEEKDKLEEEVHSAALIEESIRKYYSSELKDLGGNLLLDIYLKSKHPNQIEFSEQQKREALEKMLKSAEVARKKLRRLSLLWTKDYGERFYHHTFLIYPPHYEWLNEDGKKHSQFLAIARSIAEKGILSQDERRKQENFNNIEEKRQWQGKQNISVYDDTSGVFHDGVGLQIITFIIDQKVKDSTNVEKSQHGFAENNEFNIEGKVLPEYIIGAYVPYNEFSRSGLKISGESNEFVVELIKTMVDNPDNSFPILIGTHHYYPLDASYRKSMADELTKEERVFFGK